MLSELVNIENLGRIMIAVEVGKVVGSDEIDRTFVRQELHLGQK
jgi:hypothetical protein